MKLTIKNIGKIKESKIEIDGITVIAGANNTGKSTVGKTLFCMINGFYNSQDQINRVKATKIIESLSYQKFLGLRGKVQELLENYLIENFDLNDIKNATMISDAIKEQYARLSQENGDLFAHSFGAIFNDSHDEKVDDSLSTIIDTLKLSNEEVFVRLLENKFNTEFNYQQLNIYSKAIGEVLFEIEDNLISLEISEKGIKMQNNQIINLSKEAIYIDDPFVLDDVKSPSFITIFTDNYHRDLLVSKLAKNNNQDIVNELIISKKFDHIFEKLGFDFTAITLQNNSKIFKSANGVNKKISIKNLSTGLKAFYLIKTLLLNELIRPGGTLILDEPEIHLHPEWQLIYAELIVLIQKEFNLNVLLNTHSPYFLRAIQLYSKKHDIIDKCKYYHAKNEDNFSTINDVSDDIEEIYEQLSKPLQDLENEWWNND